MPTRLNTIHSRDARFSWEDLGPSSVQARVMFVNPIVGVDEGVLPMGASILIRTLRDRDHHVQLFDTTKYKIVEGHRSEDYGVRNINEKFLNFAPVTEGHAVKEKEQKKEREILDLFDQAVNEFKPHVIAFTVLCSHNWGMTKKLMNHLTYKDAKIILGGKHVVTSYEELIRTSWVDAVCIGDGEIALPVFCEAVAANHDYTKILNLWVREGKRTIVRNPLANLLLMDKIPFPDWSDFDERLFYKPLRGRMYRYGYVEISRGCPFKCPYCHNNKEQELFRGLGKFVRLKPVERAIEECRYLKETYGLEMVKFLDEDFLAKSKKYLQEFAKEYSKLNLPFLVAVRPERMTKENAKLLADMGCVQASVGVESGNEYIRKEIYERSIDNQIMIDGFKNFREVGIYTTALNMIGGPFETSKMIFDTIELNRHLKANDCLVSIFQPYKGTALRELCLKKGFLDEKEACEETTLENSVLNMSQIITRKEIWSFRRTFALYTRVPKWTYPLLYLCRKMDNRFTQWVFKFLSCKFGNK